MRQAKSLFSPDLLGYVSLHKPDKLPFDGVPFYERESQRYRSNIDIEELIQAAVRELPQEQLKNLSLGDYGWAAPQRDRQTPVVSVPVE